ncbi:hypothetical protein Tcan_04155 [Toxocara canis]|uniref:EB domain-containing protein n=1 Tax=Toxocara canis TaxID=6265 RepID=A0A0B2VUX0_TOXCA|nr:hypothetical protein Tcan_04155 [Toxocara canis]
MAIPMLHLLVLIVPVFAQCPSGSVSLLDNYQCITNVQCQNQAPGYICYNGICCSDGTDTVNTVPYGGYCTMSNQCRVENAKCLNNHCVCDNEYSYIGQACIPVIVNCASNEINVQGSCFRKVSYGFQCEHVEQCVYEGAICRDGLCRCAAGFVFDNTKCLPQITPGPASCQQPNATVEIVNGVVKNCLYEPCKVGFFCEYNANFNNGQHICCGNDANDIYGVVRMLPGTDKPLECSAVNSCTYVHTPNCVMSPRYGYKVCCSTMIC